MAAWFGRPEVVKLLLAAGAKLDVADKVRYGLGCWAACGDGLPAGMGWLAGWALAGGMGCGYELWTCGLWPMGYELWPMAYGLWAIGYELWDVAVGYGL